MKRRSKAGGKAGKAGRRNAATPKRSTPPKAVPSHRSAANSQNSETLRLTRERDEALEREKASAEVLRVISSSLGDLQPVFNTILVNATRLCEANLGTLELWENSAARLAASHGAPRAYLEARRREPLIRPSPNHPLGLMAATKQLVHITDILALPERAGLLARHAGARTLLIVPMLKDNELVGAINIYRQEVRPFTEKQIELLSSFAAQAVIAIENARLLSELRESLQQQTATADVLKVISSSPGQLEAVFQAMLENATRICEARFGVMFHFDAEGIFPVAKLNVPRPFDEHLRQRGRRKPQAGDLDIMLRSKRVIHTVDMLESHASSPPARLGGARTQLAVPMLKDDQLVGAIVIYRQEVRQFTDKQIALVQNFAAQAVIAIENARLLAELRQSLEQQTATADVLRVISSSPGDLEPVFQAMLDNAVRISEAKFGHLFRFDGKLFHLTAQIGNPPGLSEFFIRRGPFEPTKGLQLDRVMRTKQTVQVADDAAETIPSPPGRLAGARSVIVVPMLKEEMLIGAISIYRQEVRPFTDKQTELLQNFAAQAVIAIENTRLLSELRESLQQQTATADVLKIISRSTFDLQAVLNTLVESATKLCEADSGTLARPKGAIFQYQATFGESQEFHDYVAAHPARIDRGTAVGRTLVEGKTVLIADVLADPEYTYREGASLSGTRTILAVPLMREGTPVGVITLHRRSVRAFTEKQIELATTFADQAAIAIENARLLNELRQRTDDLTESLEQQTATSEVLKVISSSPGELEPVFQAMLGNATRICEAKFGVLYLLDGKALLVGAEVGTPAEYAEFQRRRGRFQPTRGGYLESVLQTKQTRYTADAAAESTNLPVATVGGARSLVCVPMLKDDAVVGIIAIYRQEVRPFSDKQIELLQNFAAQAVIAIENTRLLSELRESLQQQTATAQVLSVISSSPGQLEPVFQSMLENATRICEAKFGTLFRFDGEKFHLGAQHGTPAELAEFQRRRGAFTTDPGTLLDVVMRTKRLCHSADNAAEPVPGMVTKLGGARSVVAVPMLKDEELIGVIVIYRQEVRPFTEKQIALVENFAAQAVIAIENTRLLTELRQRTGDLSESLEQQTATSKVLDVISRSAFDLNAVFETVAESSVRLCGADRAFIFRFDGELLRMAVAYNSSPEFTAWVQQHPIRPGRHSGSARAALERRTIHIPDVREDSEYTYGAKDAEKAIRTILGVPILKGDDLLGVMMIYHLEGVRPFTEKQIALVETFADQAAIAIDNVRLFEAEQQRTRELSEALEQQTATSEVLKVISSSPGDLEPVFNAMLENAVHICDARFGNLLLYDGNLFRHVALHNAPLAWAEERERDPVPPRDVARILYRVADTKQVEHVPDMAAENPDEPIAVVAGARTVLIVPMLKERELVGAIAIFRQEVRPFTDKQVELLKNFAAQAVIAIENTRLLSELRESLEQQTATSDVLRVISSSPGDLEPVFQTMLQNAVRICEAKAGNIYRWENDGMRLVTSHNATAAFVEVLRRAPLRATANNPVGRMLKTKSLVHIVDLAAEQPYIEKSNPVVVAAVDVGEVRTQVSVPLLKEDEFIGAITLWRDQVRPFEGKQIELVQNFAAQAVIAIENTRLLTELHQRTDDLSELLEQQTATSEVLKVISSSPGELEPVFRTMLENAVRICEAKFGTLYLVEGDAYRTVAMHNAPPAFAEFIRQRGAFQPTPGGHFDRVMRTKQVSHTADVTADAVGSLSPAATLGGARSIVAVPMLKDDVLVGVIFIYRQEVRPFTDKHIELVQNFAAQAVIAIENTRLLAELRQSLQQQTATADVLKVISRSTFDLQTVLDTLAESAARLCEAEKATINRAQEDGSYRAVAMYGFSPEFSQYMAEHPVIPGGKGSVTGRTVMNGETVQIADVMNDPDYQISDRIRIGDVRTLLGVPLLREGTPTGVLVMMRSVVKPFTEKQIELAQTFADQAVIAIENARLVDELRKRSQDLSNSLDDLRTAQDRLVQTQKLASLGQLTAGIAHEIKNPLNFVNNFSGVSVELIDELQQAVKHGSFDDKTQAEVAELTGTLRDNLDKIVQHGKRADSIVKNMLLHSREGSGERRAVDVNALVEESLNLAYHGARAEKQGFDIALERSFDPAAGEVDVFPQEITRVLLNLIANGFYAATKRQGQEGANGFEPTIAAATKSLGDRVEIRIRDNGIGIPPEVREKMFNPFFTTKPAGEGTGLGLSISHDIIVKQHSGTIEVDTEPGAFTEFRIILPRTAA